MADFDLFEWIKGLKTKTRSAPAGGGGGGRGIPTGVSPSVPPPRRMRRLLGAVVVIILVCGIYIWEFRRVVVPADHVMVLMKKNGGSSLPADQYIIPRPPDKQKQPQQHAEWEKKYGDMNGILEQVVSEGVYFGYSPFDYERHVIPIGSAAVPNRKVGVVVRKFGGALPAGQVLADAAKGQRGPLPQLLNPGRYNEFANPWAYEVKHFEPVVVEPGEEGVVTLMAGNAPKNSNAYLVNEDEQGTQSRTEPPGFRYVNLYQKRIMPINMRSHKFEMIGNDSIGFPSSDSFMIRMQGFVEWRIVSSQLPLLYVQYGEGGELIPFLEEKVILPHARSLSRLVGSQYAARDFITGDTKLKFQQDFEKHLREECLKQGIEVRQALVRDIEPPVEIKDPINDREISKEQIKQYEQQILVAKTQAEFTTQEQMAEQNKSIGDANRQVVTIVKKAEQQRDVGLTRAKQDLEVAKLRLQAARKEGDALVERGKADAAVILLKAEAQAKPLAMQVGAFGDGNAYAQYFFQQKVAGSIKSVMTNTDGPLGEMFKQLLTPSTQPAKSASGN